MKDKQIKSFFKKTSALMGILAILAVIIFFSIIMYIDNNAKGYCYNNINDIPNADAVIVLGAFVYKGGAPSAILCDRLDYGLKLYNAGKVKKIILSGDHGTKEYDEVNAMKDYLLKRGVPRENLFLDHAGFNTYDSMYRAREIFRVKSLIVSTQQFHINRSIYIARRQGIEAYGYPSEDKKYYNLNYLNGREILAKIKAFIDSEITKRSPKYLGDPIPINGNGLLTEG